MSKLRIKECFKCSKQKEVMYRCRYDGIKDWVFVCRNCLKQIKNLSGNTYQYGGTWKSNKK